MEKIKVLVRDTAVTLVALAVLFGVLWGVVQVLGWLFGK